MMAMDIKWKMSENDNKIQKLEGYIDISFWNNFIEKI